MAAFHFGDFELDTDRRYLRAGDRPVRIGARAFDILACLVSKAGEIVSKDEIIQTAWPSTYVDEVSLRVHMVAVRKAILNGGSRPCIENIPGRGYQFTKAVYRVDNQVEDEVTSSPAFVSGLPSNLNRLIGREQFVEQCVILLRERRVLTITGPGGIGKTSVAVEIAQREVDNQPVIFVDLASLSTEGLIASHIAGILNIDTYNGEPMSSVIDAIGVRRMLFLFDNCEHLIDEAATVVEQLLLLTPNATILATSREPLRIQSETVRDLPGLSFPSIDQGSPLTSDFGAMELFNERIAMVGEALVSDEDHSHAAEIVRRLDGIPLAIELAAARVVEIGLASLSCSLSNPLNLLQQGLRTAPARHQTLKATIDWSYALLSPDEQILLMHLSVFAGSFDYEAAAAVSSTALVSELFEDAIAGLRAKSLLSTSSGGKKVRLLQATRAFADTMLRDSVYEQACRSAHAVWVNSQLVKANAEWPLLQTTQWVDAYRGLIQDVRVALNWMLETSVTSQALEICASSHIFWSQFGLMNEQLKVLERVIGQDAPPLQLSPSLEMRLRSAYGSALFHVVGPASDDEAIWQFTSAATIAEELGDSLEIVRAHSGNCAILTTHGAYRQSEAVALRLESELGVSGSGATTRILAMNAHFLGEHDRMNALCEDAIRLSDSPVGRTTTSGAGYDQRTVAYMLMAKTAWIQGRSKSAARLTEEAIAEALNMDNAISLCLSLAVSACPVYLGVGEMDAAQHHISMLRDVSTKHSLSRWRQWSDGYECLLPGQSSTAADIEQDLAATGLGARLETMVVLAGGNAGLSLVERALRGDAVWCRSELLRAKGELLQRVSPSQANELFSQAFHLAERQGALLWQLRSAGSLVRYAIKENRDHAIDVLRSTLEAFPEPPSKADLEASNALLWA